MSLPEEKVVDGELNIDEVRDKGKKCRMGGGKREIGVGHEKRKENLFGQAWRDASPLDY